MKFDMKNPMWMWVGGAVLLLVVLVMAFGGNKSQVATTDKDGGTNADVKVAPAPTPKTPAAKPIEGMKVSLGGIFNEKGSYQCDYEQVSQQTRNSSVVYISNGKMRGEFRTSTAVGGTATMVVYDGDYLYVWTEGKSTGTRTQPKTIAELPGIIPEDVSSGRILGSSATNVSWNCHAWSVKPALLARPSYVNF